MGRTRLAVVFLFCLWVAAFLCACAAPPEAPAKRQENVPQDKTTPAVDAEQVTLDNVEFILNGPWDEAPDFLVDDMETPPDKIYWVPGVSDTDDAGGFPFVSFTSHTGSVAVKGFERYLAAPESLVERTRGRFDPSQGYKSLGVVAKPELGVVVHTYEIIDIEENRPIRAKMAAVRSQSGLIEVEYYGQPGDTAWLVSFDAMLEGLRRVYRL